MKYPMLLLLTVGVVFGHQKMLDGISPHVIQRGAESTVIVQGHRLFEIEQYLAYAPGIEMVRAEPLTEVVENHYFKKKEAKPGRALSLTLKVAPDCKLGQHFFRLRTDESLSEMRSIWISPFPCVKEEQPGHDNRDKNIGNHTFELAQPVELQTTVVGHHPAYSVRDYDFYRVELRRGQRFTVEQWAACFAFGGGNDGVLTVYGPDKKEIARVDDTWLRGDDPVLSIVARVDGAHYVKVHQSVERELGARQYAVHFGSGIRPLVVYPLGGQAGQKLVARLVGEVGKDTTATIPLPGTAGEFDESTFDYRPEGTVIANPLRVSAYANFLEDGSPHFKPESAQRYDGDLPVAFNGIIEDEGKTDWFRFKARKGERYRVRCYAATLGSPSDPQFWIQGAPGSESKVKMAVQDSYWEDRAWSAFGRWSTAANMDPIAIFEPDVDGEYILGIADEQRLFGPDYAYRIEVEPMQSQVQFCITTDYRESSEKRDVLVVPRGNRIERTWRKVKVPGNIYGGAFDVVADGLPDGVTFRVPTVAPGAQMIQVQVEATAQAKPWAGFIDLRFVPRESGADFTGGYVLNAAGESARGGLIDNVMQTRRCALAVVESAPFKLHLKEPQLALAQSAVLDLEVELERVGDFTGAVQISAPWLPPAVSAGTLLIPAGKTTGMLQLKATDRATPGSYPLVLSATQDLLTHTEGDVSLNTGTGFDFVATNEVQIEVVKPYLEVRLARAAIERQKDGEIVAEVKHIRPLPSTATARLVRLPAGAELISSVTIQPGNDSIRFPIRVSKSCLTGLYKDITCEISIEANGQTITQLSGRGTLRVDAERK